MESGRGERDAGRGPGARWMRMLPRWLLYRLLWLEPVRRYLFPTFEPVAGKYEAREQQARHPGSDGGPIGGRSRHRERSIQVSWAFAGVVMAAVIAILVLAGHGAPRAAAAPDQAAAAAGSAGSFAFTSESELLTSNRVVRASRTTGEVNLRQHAVRSTVTEAGSRSGFERLLFTTAVYTRATSGRAAGFWVGSEISPHAMISVSAGSGGGLADTTALLAALSRIHHATPLGTRSEAGALTWGYRVTTTLGSLTDIEGVPLSYALANTPVTITVWLDHNNHLIRAMRTIALPDDQRLRIATRFARYGQPTSIERPDQPTAGSQRLNPFAGDPIGASIVTALAVGTGHTSASASNRQSPRSARRHAR